MQADGSSETRATNRALLSAWLSDNEPQFHTALRSFARMAHQARGQSVDETCLELVVEVAAIALDRAERFDPTRPPLAWLLGIANNVVRRWKEERTQHNQRHVPSDFARRGGQAEDTDTHAADIFERLTETAVPGAEVSTLGTMWVEQVLRAVSGEDAQILRLAVLEARDMNDIAQRLHTTPGAARVRLHRALKRARQHVASEQDAENALSRRGGYA